MGAVGSVDQAVARDVHAVRKTRRSPQVGGLSDQEGRGHPRRLRASFERVVGLQAVPSPVPLVGAGVRVEDDDPLVDVSVGDVDLVGRRVEIDA